MSAVCPHTNVVPIDEDWGRCEDCGDASFPISRWAAGGCAECGSYGECDTGCAGAIVGLRTALLQTRIRLDQLDGYYEVQTYIVREERRWWRTRRIEGWVTSFRAHDRTDGNGQLALRVYESARQHGAEEGLAVLRSHSSGDVTFERGSLALTEDP